MFLKPTARFRRTHGDLDAAGEIQGDDVLRIGIARQRVRGSGTPLGDAPKAAPQ